MIRAHALVAVIAAATFGTQAYGDDNPLICTNAAKNFRMELRDDNTILLGEDVFRCNSSGMRCSFETFRPRMDVLKIHILEPSEGKIKLFRRLDGTETFNVECGYE